MIVLVINLSRWLCEMIQTFQGKVVQQGPSERCVQHNVLYGRKKRFLEKEHSFIVTVATVTYLSREVYHFSLSTRPAPNRFARHPHQLERALEW